MSATIPAKTHAAQITKHGGFEVIEFNEIDTPTPKPDEILFKVEWGGVNYIDNYHRAGLYPIPFPFTLGQEAAGTIVQLPTSPEVLESEAYKKRGFQVGDKVATVEGRAYAGYASIPWTHVAKIPSDVSTRDAAASLLQGLTALTAVKESYEVKKGDIILVHAVAGGLGLQFTQIAKLLGATVIGTTSTPEKAELAKKYGADHVILYTQENIVDEVKRITNGVGVAAVFDGVGKDTWEGNFELIARKGTIVTIGNASGPTPPFPALKLAAKNLKVTRPKLGNFLVTEEEFDYYTQEYFKLLQQVLKILIHKEYPFSAEGVRQSQIDISSRGTVGKLLINVGAGPA